jgi:hypothetical protein
MKISHDDPHCRIGKITPKGNIELFPGVTDFELPARQQPDEGVINLLAHLIEGAAEGHIRGVAIAWIEHTGNTASDWAGGEGYVPTLLLGTLHILAHNYASKTVQGSDRLAEDPKEPA